MSNSLNVENMCIYVTKVGDEINMEELEKVGTSTLGLQLQCVTQLYDH